MRPIVLATDGSPSAAQATKVAVELAHETGAHLFVVAAWEAALTAYPYAPVATMPDVEKADRARAATAARAAIDCAEEAGVDADSVVRQGDAVDIVSATAKEIGASLIVVGSHGWGKFRRLVFGSVSMALLHNPPCPVLVARYDQTAPDARADEKEKVVA